DIVGSTETASALGDRRWKELLERHDRAVRGDLDRFGGEEIKHTGDGFLVTFDSPARAIRFARSLRPKLKHLGIEIRTAIHTGECESSGRDLAGVSVHIAARVRAEAGPGEVLVSSSGKDLVIGSEIKFRPRGAHVLKGAPGKWELYELDDDTVPPGSATPDELAPVKPDLDVR